MSRFKQYKRKLRWKNSIRKEGAGMDPSCPECGSPMHWRDAAGLTGMHPEGAWECSNQRCWHMLTPGNLAPDTPPPDLDTGHSDLTLPEHWGGRRMAGGGLPVCPNCGGQDVAPLYGDMMECRGCGYDWDEDRERYFRDINGVNDMYDQLGELDGLPTTPHPRGQE